MLKVIGKSKSIQAIGYRICAIGIAIAVSILLPRVLGKNEFGIYTFALALVTFASIFARSGLPVFVVREVSIFKKSNKDQIEKIMDFATVVLISSSCLAIFIYLMVLYFQGYFHKTELPLSVLFAVIPLIIISPMLLIYGAAVRALGAVIKGQLPDGIVRPAIMLLLIALIGAVAEIQAITMVLINLVASIFALFVTILYYQRLKDSILNPPPYAEVNNTKTRLKSLLPLALTSGATAVHAQADIVMLGSMLSTDQVADYRIALTCVLFINLGQQAIAPILSPKIAAMSQELDIGRMQIYAVREARISVIIAIPISIALLFWGDTIVTQTFGPDFSGAQGVVPVLMIGYIFSLLCGFCGEILAMKGYERIACRAVITAAILNVSLNYWLIPHFGIYGSAIALSISMVLQNTLLWIWARKHVGVRTDIFCSTRSAV